MFDKNFKNLKEKKFLVKILYGNDFNPKTFKRKSALNLSINMNSQNFSTNVALIENDNCHWKNNFFDM